MRALTVPGILIVDDNRTIRYLLRTFVESKTKFPVCGEAENGTEAIEKAQQLQPDLILLDLAMPVMNGADAAAILKRMLPQTKIILFTMYGGAEMLATVVGADLVLSKTDGLFHLDEHLNALLMPTIDTKIANKLPLPDDATPN